MAKMDDRELQNILASELNQALGQDGGTLSYERQKLMDYYMGKMPSAEEGRSNASARNCLEVVETTLPWVLSRFYSDSIFNFEPSQPDDQEKADQASQYVNFIFREQDGYQKLYVWFRDAIGLKVGYIKCFWEDYSTTSVSTYTGLTDEEFAQITDDPDTEVLEHTVTEESVGGNPDAPPTPPMGDGPPMSPPMGAPPMGPPPAGPMPPPMGPPPGMPPPPPMMNGGPPPELAASISAAMAMMPPPTVRYHDVKVRVSKYDGCVKILNLPPEEVLVSPHTNSVDLDGRHFCAHRSIKSVSELREMGFSEKLIEEAASASANRSSLEYNNERMSRYDDLDFPPTSLRTDEAMRDVVVTESYIRVDFDGDGIAELRRVVSAGDNNPIVILSNEECDEVPIIAICPIPLSHRHYGLSVADLVTDLQEIKTAVIRQILDSLYLANTPRIVVSEMSMTESTIEDLLNHRIGSVIRANDVQGIQALQVPFVAAQSMPVVQYLDSTQEVRSGISRNAQGLDPQTFANETATSANLMISQSSQRMELITRCLADQGVKTLGKRILGLVTKHQQRERVVKLTGKWVPIDPRDWKNSFDISISLGPGSKDQVLQHLMGILQIQQQIITFQKGVQGPLVNADDVYNVLERLTEAGGFRGEQFFTDPKNMPPKPPGPEQMPPELMKAQAEIQAAQQKAQAEIQLNQQKAAAQMQMEQARSQNDMVLEKLKLESQIAVEQERARAQIELEILRERLRSQNEMMQPQQQPQMPQ